MTNNARNFKFGSDEFMYVIFLNLDSKNFKII